MSVQTEIDRIISSVDDAYDSVASKGGSVPAARKVASLASAIDSIPSGGGGSMATIDGWIVSTLTNGLVIATCEVECNAVPCSAALGSWFQSSAIAIPDYPEGIFAQAPRVTMQFHTTASASALVWTVGNQNWDQLARPEPILLIRPVSGTITGTIHVIAIGTSNADGEIPPNAANYYF